MTATTRPAGLPGAPFPLGATPGKTGTNFAVVSGGDGVLLCAPQRAPTLARQEGGFDTI
ncbi:MAG TPA: hypothetical protein VEK80_16055 [Kribbellaceae bacterium]|nr:hypothetical protein [Kribbellaceae bacterium]